MPCYERNIHHLHWYLTSISDVQCRLLSCTVCAGYQLSYSTPLPLHSRHQTQALQNFTCQSPIHIFLTSSMTLGPPHTSSSPADHHPIPRTPLPLTRGHCNNTSGSHTTHCPSSCFVWALVDTSHFSQSDTLAAALTDTPAMASGHDTASGTRRMAQREGQVGDIV